MTRKYIIAGNWKMNKKLGEAVSFAKSIIQPLSHIVGVDIIICPSFISLSDICSILKETNIKVCAQNIFWEEEGAFTGEISSSMIKDIGCQYTIIGHSERRQYFFETDEVVNKKIKAALNFELKPIVCVGETLSERDSGITYEVIKRQVQEALSNIDKTEMDQICLAYEPVWAIGTGKTATPAQANEVHNFIRKRLENIFDEQIASSTTILYGGSVKPDNINELIKEKDIDGALVGGASLDSDSFIKLVNSCQKHKDK